MALSAWGDPLTPGVPTGWVWSRRAARWESSHEDVLVVGDRRILLVPKAVVSFAKRYAAGPYYRHFVLSFLQHEHLRLNTPLVEHIRRKDGTERRRVTKKRLAEAAAPPSKDFLAEFTAKYPEVFRDFKRRREGDDSAVSADVFTPEDRRAVIDHLIEMLGRIPPGGEHATLYHRTVAGILELVFYPDLFAPVVGQGLHGGRKRIDIVFENGATGGFFRDLDRRHRLPAPWILAECKNYGREVGNPELDQLAGRFSPTRGKFGYLVRLSVEDMPTLLARCADTDRDDRGLILPLVDADLIALLEDARSTSPRAYDRLPSN